MQTKFWAEGSQSKRPLISLKHSIIVNLIETGCGGGDWIELAQDGLQ
jgi:hypothetical protein